RSWLAVSLVGGLLVFTAVSFWLDDTQLRNTLIGGVVASAGAAAAFYFASKGADRAREDILGAALPAITVPNVVGKSRAEAEAALARLPVRADLDPATAAPESQVLEQYPLANQTTPTGSHISLKLAGPVPKLDGMTPAEAQAALERVNLALDSDPPAPA